MPGANAIHDLPRLQWLGAQFYASNIETSWSHRLATREYPYVDGEGHESTGRAALKVSADLHFLNTIEPGMYPGKWHNARGLLLSTQSGTLLHPDIGKFHARNVEGSYTISPKTTAGVIVRASWVESLKSVDEPTKIVPNSADTAASAKQIDDSMAILDLPYPDGMADLDVTFEELANQIGSLGFTFSLQLSGLVNQAKGYVTAVYNAEQLLCKGVQLAEGSVRDAIAGSPTRWLFEAACEAMLEQLNEQEKAATEAARTVKTYTTANDSSLAALSLNLNAEIGDLIELNPKLCGALTVNKGTLVKYFAA